MTVKDNINQAMYISALLNVDVSDFYKYENGKVIALDTGKEADENDLSLILNMIETELETLQESDKEDEKEDTINQLRNSIKKAFKKWKH